MNTYSKEDMLLAGQVAIVTGAGRGLGRTYALALAQQGVRVVVNDCGCDLNGYGRDPSVAQSVVDSIRAAGGQAVASAHDVADFQQAQALAALARQTWGRIDILIHNAAILRDRSFAKIDLHDFRATLDVVLMGAVHVCKAVWSDMQQQNYGRIVLSTAATGLFGQYGQTSFGAANLGVIGFMQSLGLEAERYGICVNCLAPTAATRMMEALVPEEIMGVLQPEAVLPAVRLLVGKDAPQRMVLCTGAGTFETAHVVMTPGKYLHLQEEAQAVQQLRQALPEIARLPEGVLKPAKAEGQVTNEVWNTMAARGQIPERPQQPN